MSKLILASASPRRKELLTKHGFEFEIITADIDERKIEEQYPDPVEAVKQLALAKAQAVFTNNPDTVVIGADTVVVYKGKTLGKPENKDHAYNMLRSLSGNEHAVYTGVAVLCKSGKTVFADKASVLFRELSDKDIESYIATGSPFDKAGSYGIQDSDFVKEINGSFDNVMGLPAQRLAPILRDILTLE